MKVSPECSWVWMGSSSEHRLAFILVVINNLQHLSFSPGTTQPIVGVYFTALYRALASSRTRLLDHIQRRATVGRTPLNE